MSHSPTAENLRVNITRKDILKTAVPISVALLVPQINFMVNSIFISALGETELGTAAITGVYYLIFSLIGTGLNNGIQALMARRAGQNRAEEIGRIFIQGLWISFFFAAASILITYLTGPLLLSSTIRSRAVYEQTLSFLKIRIWGLVFLYAFQVGNALLVGTNNSKYMKFGFWFGSGLHILLDYCLIFGNLGMPRLGFNGAAIASLIAEFFGLAIVFFILFLKKMHHTFSLFKSLSFQRPLSALIFRQSLPLVAQYVISIVAWLIFYILIENTGERPLAISNTMRNVFGIFGVFAWAFGSAANAMVSNIIGQGRQDQVLLLIHRISGLSFLFVSVMCAILNLFPELFFSLYRLEESFVSEAIPVFRVVSVGVLAMSLASVWLNSVTGTGNTKINLLIELAAITAYCIYIYFVIKVLQLNLVWAWTSELVYWAVLLSLSYFYLQKGNWKDKVI
ncbi:MAG: MATE family efflux transporter [Chitinophagaceae bacterium]|nr:MATE family efflux transporter [Chitinophagaceae bacterium]